MRVEVVNKSKRLRVQYKNNVNASEGRYIADNIPVALAKELAHWVDGDKLSIMLMGGNPSVTVYEREIA
jgi:hypothetical protein